MLEKPLCTPTWTGWASGELFKKMAKRKIYQTVEFILFRENSFKRSKSFLIFWYKKEIKS